MHADEIVRVASVSVHLRRESVGARLAVCAVGDRERRTGVARGEADGAATKAKGLAEAQAIQARAQALAENQEAVINQQIAQELPQIVAESAKAFGSIGQLTVLSGAQGVSEFLTNMIGAGVAAVPMLRQMLHGETDGRATADGKGGGERTKNAKAEAARDPAAH